MKSGEPQEKQVPVQAGRLSEKGWEAQRHHYASSCDCSECCQEPARCSTKLIALSKQAAEHSAPRATKGKHVDQQEAHRSPSTGVVQHKGVALRQKQRDAPLFINTPETAMLLWKVILFQNFTHSATDHALQLSPLQIHSLQAWERWGIISSPLTASTHMLRVRALLAACQEAESSLLFP